MSSIKAAGKTFTLLAIGVLLVVAQPATAGSIEGFLYTPFNTVQSELSVCTNMDGNLQGYGQGTSWAATPVGWYGIYSLPPGTYEMLFNEKDAWPRYLQFGISVPASGKATVNRRIDYQDHVTGLTWDPELRTEWCQSFMATGTCITSVGLHQAIEFGPDTMVEIHDTDPNGAQIGPSRVIPTVVVNPSAAYWDAGEVPTTPGHIYCVKFIVPFGQRPFLSGAKVQNGNAFPDGYTWRDGELTDGPVKIVVGQDDDGIITVVNTKKTNSNSLPLYFSSGTAIGQTFTAKGSSLLSVSMLVGSTGGRLRATVYDSPGVNGQGANQVGFSKYIKPVDFINRSGAVWKPGEVPLQEGHQYYIKITRPDGQPFTCYWSMDNEYSGGNMFIDGTEYPYDLSTTICCEAFPGSASLQKIGISNVSATRGAVSATISWQTSTATTNSYVDYGPTTPYTSRDYEPGTTNHSVTLTGLTPNTLYHYRIVAKANGARDTYSRDFVFVTDPIAPNLIQNPAFETGSLSPWTQFIQGESSDYGVRNKPWDAPDDWFGAKAHAGTYFFGSVTNGLINKGGIYQQIPVAPGKPLNVRAWLWTWQQDNMGAFLDYPGSNSDYTCKARIGIDPNGGTDPTSPAIVWCRPIVAQDLFGDDKGIWSEGWATATPVSNQATVFLWGGAGQRMSWTIFGFDDIVATQTPPPTELPNLGSLNTVSDGTPVSIADAVVTATSDQIGSAYVEQSDRSAGIRVESSDSFTVGNVVSIEGTVGTKPSGERFIFSATKTADAGGQPAKAMDTTARSIGKTALTNVGVLMRVAGKVAAGGAGFVYVNDGSLAGNGLKVMTGSLTDVPASGTTAAFTGIVQLEGTTPAGAIPVLYPRSQADCQTF